MGLWANIKSFFGGKKKCTCMQSPNDGKFYCYKQVQGRLEACSGPYNSLQDCISRSGEKCS